MRELIFGLPGPGLGSAGEIIPARLFGSNSGEAHIPTLPFMVSDRRIKSERRPGPF